jgi:hypothetical protein
MLYATFTFLYSLPILVSISFTRVYMELWTMLWDDRWYLHAKEMSRITVMRIHNLRIQLELEFRSWEVGMSLFEYTYFFLIPEERKIQTH